MLFSFCYCPGLWPWHCECHPPAVSVAAELAVYTPCGNSCTTLKETQKGLGIAAVFSRQQKNLFWKGREFIFSVEYLA